MEFTSYCFCIETSPFFWKDLNARSAAQLLRRSQPQSFLVRPSRNPSFKYTLSQKVRNKITHIRIKKDTRGQFFFDMDGNGSEASPARFSCVANMINCWCRVYRETQSQCILTPVCHESGSGYVNDRPENVCFNDDEAADRSFFNHCVQLIARSS